MQSVSAKYILAGSGYLQALLGRCMPIIGYSIGGPPSGAQRRFDAEGFYNHFAGLDRPAGVSLPPLYERFEPYRVEVELTTAKY
jgi:hypothetical protein